MSRKAWIIFAIVCAGLLAGLVVAGNQSSSIDLNNVDPNKIQPASEQSGNIGDHVFGNRDSKVLLIEYGDYQCPGCASLHTNLKPILEKYDDKLAFVYRNIPLSSIHPNARAAAAAAESAGRQGKFWEMHNLLYENQVEWSSLSADKRFDAFSRYAQSLGLDKQRFQDDTTSRSIGQKIKFDEALFDKTGYKKATPVLLLNGSEMSQDTWSDVIKLEQTIKQAIEKADK